MQHVIYEWPMMLQQYVYHRYRGRDEVWRQLKRAVDKPEFSLLVLLLTVQIIVR